MNYQKDIPISIENLSFDIKENVSSILTDGNNSLRKYTFYEQPINKDKINIFFILETPFHLAFYHWVFESAIFYLILNILKGLRYYYLKTHIENIKNYLSNYLILVMKI